MKPSSFLKIVMGIMVFSFIAAFTSQSLVDLADTLVVLTALLFAYKNDEFNNYFRGFKPVVLWPIWLVIIFLGLYLDLGFFSFQTWINFVEFRWILTLLSIIYLTKKAIDPQKFLKINAMVILVLNLISLFLFFYRHDSRAAGIFDAVMAFSHNIAPIFSFYTIFIFVNWIYFDRNKKTLMLIVAFISAFLTLLTYTRGVWLGSVVAIATALFIWNFKRAAQVLSAFALVSAVLLFSSPRIQERIFSKTYEETSSNDARLALWKANLMMVRDCPIFGVGFNQNRYYLPIYFQQLGIPKGSVIISHAHNQYLQVWAGTGTLGFICYLFFLFSIFKTAWRGYKNALQENKGLMLGLIAALLCFVIGALTEANFNISKNRFLFLLLAGLAIGFSDKEKVPGPVSGE